MSADVDVRFSSEMSELGTDRVLLWVPTGAPSLKNPWLGPDGRRGME